MSSSPTDQLRPFSQSLPMALLRARESTMRSFRRGLAVHDLTEQQWRVLRALATNPAGLEIREVAEQTFLLGPSLSRILSNLERRSLVDRHPVENDQRRNRMVLAPAGTEIVAAIAPDSEARYAEIESKLGPDTYQQLLALLERLAELDLGTDLDATDETREAS